jgi:hypothetical protein
MRIAVAVEGRKARIPHMIAWPMHGTRESLDVPDDRTAWDPALARAFDAGHVVEVPAIPAAPIPARRPARRRKST